MRRLVWMMAMLPDQGLKVVQRPSETAQTLTGFELFSKPAEQYRVCVCGGGCQGFYNQGNVENEIKRNLNYFLVLLVYVSLSSIHTLVKLCPVLNNSLVSNRQEPQLSDTCLAHIHSKAGSSRNSSCKAQIIPMWVSKSGHLAILSTGVNEMVELSDSSPQVWSLCQCQAQSFLSLLLLLEVARASNMLAFQSIGKAITNSWLYIIGMLPFPSANFAMETDYQCLEITKSYCFILQMERLRPTGFK